jgi:hypothetical protein
MKNNEKYPREDQYHECNQPNPPGWANVAKAYMEDRPHWSVSEAVNLLLSLNPERVSLTSDPINKENDDGFVVPPTDEWVLDKLERKIWKYHHLILKSIAYGDLDKLPVEGPMGMWDTIMEPVPRDTHFEIHLYADQIKMFAQTNSIELPEGLSLKSDKPYVSKAQTSRHIENRDSTWLAMFSVLAIEGVENYQLPNGQLNITAILDRVEGLAQAKIVPQPLGYQTIQKQFKQSREAIESYLA